MNTDLTLQDLRAEIDKVDDQLLRLLAARSRLVQKVAEAKCKQNLAIYDGNREAEIINRLVSNNPTFYQDVDLENIFHTILRAGLNQQLLYRSEQES